MTKPPSAYMVTTYCYPLIGTGKKVVGGGVCLVFGHADESVIRLKLDTDVH